MRIGLVGGVLVFLYFVLIGWAVFLLEKELTKLCGACLIELPSTDRLLSAPGSTVRALLGQPAGC